MKKIIIILLLFLFAGNVCQAALKSNEINILNLKVKNMYILSLNSKALNIINDKKSLLDIYPITSIENDGKEIFIDAKNAGVYDVDIQTEKDDYKLRIIIGSTFEDDIDDLTLIDLPIKFGGNK